VEERSNGWRFTLSTTALRAGDTARLLRRHPFRTLLVLGIAIIGLDIGSLPFGDLYRLRKINPRETELMREQERLAREQGTTLRRVQVWTPLDKIPSTLIDAVIVAEDGTFWSNQGFDWFEFKESVWKDIRELKPARGASTITQQLVKNLYLSPSKNPLRKLKEWILTWYAERTLTKSRILELYLNTIEWGDGIYGAGAAARYHFGKDVADLSRDECARLAAIIPSPRRHRADSNSSYVIRRSKIVIARMDARGWGLPPPDENFFESGEDTIPAESGRVNFDSTSGIRDSL